MLGQIQTLVLRVLLDPQAAEDQLEHEQDSDRHDHREDRGEADALDLGPDLLTAPVAVRISDLGESAIEILIRADTKPGTQWGLTWEFRKRLLARFEMDDIAIPFQNLTVHFGDR